jgi:hypothetical protein
LRATTKACSLFGARVGFEVKRTARELLSVRAMRTTLLTTALSLSILGACSSSTEHTFEATTAHLEGRDRLQARHSGLCVGVNGAAVSGAPLVQTTCEAGLALEIQPIGDVARLHVRGTDECVDMPGGSAEPYAKFQLASCSDAPSQRFSVIDDGANVMSFKTAHDLCFDVGSNSKELGAPMVQWDCHLEPNQRFAWTSAASCDAPPTAPAPTAPTTPPVAPVAPSDKVNSLDTIVDDMRLVNDAPLAGVPAGPGWAVGPGYVIMGNNPRGSGTPSWWQPADTTYKSDAYWNVILPWIVLFDGVGNAATNTRVEMRDLQVYAKSRASGAWSRIQDPSNVVGELYPKHLQGDVTSTPDQQVNGNVTSVRPPGGDLLFHGWGTMRDIDAPDVKAIFVTMQARLAVGANGSDDRAAAKYLIHVGADYYPTAGTRVSAFTPSSYLPGVGVSRAKLVTNEWRAFNFSTLDVAKQDPGGSISEAELRAAPPPLE